MFMIEIGGVKVLYTGDYSTEDDRHLMAAEHPSHSPDLIASTKSLCCTRRCCKAGNVSSSHCA